jgi:hypothetical protein
MLIAVCWPPRDEQQAAAGHDGGTATRSAPATTTASGNARKVTKCGRRGLPVIAASIPRACPWGAFLPAVSCGDDSAADRVKVGPGKVVVPFLRSRRQPRWTFTLEAATSGQHSGRRGHAANK